jgi:hypothetical protein
MNTHLIKQSLLFTAGVGVGAGSTWLFATRGGRRARLQFAHMVKDGGERLSEAGQDAFEKGKEMLNRGKELAEEAGAAVGRRLHLASK